MGGLEVVDERYRPIAQRAIDVLQADPRVDRVTIGGSVGDGTADRWSDLDLQVEATLDGHASLVEEWPQWLADITPTVFARTPLAPFIVNAVTNDGLTLDFAVWRGAAPLFTPPTDYTVGMMSGVRFATIGPALEYAVLEQLRGLAGPFISLVRREEHLRHLTGVPHLVGLLTTVFLAETGAAPPTKHWNHTFTEEQRASVGALPPAGATQDGVVGFGLALAELLVSRARPLFPRYDLVWPAPLAAVAAGRVRDHLAIETSSWLH